MPRKKKVIPPFEKAAGIQLKIAEAVLSPLAHMFPLVKAMPEDKDIVGSQKVLEAVLDTYTALARVAAPKATCIDRAGMVLAYREMQHQVETYMNTSKFAAKKLDMKVIEKLVNEVLEVSQEIKK
jgi:hypothetical protein